MPDPTRRDADNTADTTDAGWRIKQLRLRRGLQQKALAQLANVDAAFLNRLERGGSRRSKPKPETIYRLLEALQATPAEREAVFHMEVPPPSDEEIEAFVAEIASELELSPEPSVLVDNRWYRRYINRVGRRMYGLTDDEYRRSVNVHTLAAYVDPDQPIYSRYRDEDRLYHFARRVLTFRIAFAAQQFDSWYLDVERYLKRFPMGRSVWENTELVVPPTFMLSQEVTYQDPQQRIYRLMGRVDILLKDPRFMLLQLSPQDDETRRLLDALNAEED
ncbi:MAG: helix-turn-helix domain-containing protein [Chloroflexota bacterium]|nr:helix-turn-helix domain-containing protein [Chloroflexota bacterium]MDQ5864304.1 helix-turn-helix domain-containing protein [Chloroflexota bacterium]